MTMMEEEEDRRRRKESDLLLLLPRWSWMDRKLLRSRRRKSRRGVAEGCKGSERVVEVDLASSAAEVGRRRSWVEVEVAEEDPWIEFDSRTSWREVVDPLDCYELLLLLAAVADPVLLTIDLVEKKTMRAWRRTSSLRTCRDRVLLLLLLRVLPSSLLLLPGTDLHHHHLLSRILLLRTLLPASWSTESEVDLLLLLQLHLANLPRFLLSPHCRVLSLHRRYDSQTDPSSSLLPTTRFSLD